MRESERVALQPSADELVASSNEDSTRNDVMGLSLSAEDNFARQPALPCASPYFSCLQIKSVHSEFLCYYCLPSMFCFITEQSSEF